MAPMKVQARHVRKGDKIWNATPGPYHNNWVTVKSVNRVNDNWMLIDTSAWQLNISVESEMKIRRSRRKRPLQVSLDGGKTIINRNDKGRCNNCKIDLTICF